MTKNKILSLGFIIIICIGQLLSIIFPDAELSFSERRKLASFPVLNFQDILSPVYMESFDKYVTDQFIFRDSFRHIKALFELKVLGTLDINGIYIYNDYIFKKEYPIDEDSVYNLTGVINNLFEHQLKNAHVYYSIIPDKNYFVPDEAGYPKLDYDRLQDLMAKGLNGNIEYIDIFDTLTMDDYYKSDVHWRQENLEGVVKRLGDKMDFKAHYDFADYKQSSFNDFYGGYHGQLALNLKSEVLYYLENTHTKNSYVDNFENEENHSVYDIDKLGGMDSYDVYLQGATPIIEISNPKSITDKELIIFRDSFGSSMAPLLLYEYSKITLVDLRYVNSSYLDNFLDFENQDILFLYSTLLINNSYTIR